MADQVLASEFWEREVWRSNQEERTARATAGDCTGRRSSKPSRDRRSCGIAEVERFDEGCLQVVPFIWVEIYIVFGSI